MRIARRFSEVVNPNENREFVANFALLVPTVDDGELWGPIFRHCKGDDEYFFS